MPTTGISTEFASQQRAYQVAVVASEEQRSPFPRRTGAYFDGDSVRWTLVAPLATEVHVVIFTPSTPPEEIGRMPLTVNSHGVWTGIAPKDALPDGFRYMLSVDGQDNPDRGISFDKSRLQTDPGSEAVTDPSDGVLAHPTDTNLTPLCVPVPESQRRGPIRPLEAFGPPRRIVEAHVKAVTALHPTVEDPGTYKALAQAYVRRVVQLGADAVEFLPVADFVVHGGHSLPNFWGYGPRGNFKALHPDYAASRDPLKRLTEFRELVAAFADSGVAVILDVVYNHTDGPALHGIDPEGYRRIDQYHDNASGCGNTIDINHAPMRERIKEALHYWVEQMGVRGFRFDAATILMFQENGALDEEGKFFVELQEELPGVVFIVEPWSCGGHYGSNQGQRQFPEGILEWDDTFRDEARRWLRGFATVGALPYLLTGSTSIFDFSHGETWPKERVIYVCSHDGFTLWDLVSYNDKHNGPNLENNRDGHKDNESWNSGSASDDGPSTNPEVNRLRLQRVRAAKTILSLARGVKQELYGDEELRTQRGNNNPWCQDNDTTYLSWDLNEDERRMLDFSREINDLDEMLPILSETTGLGEGVSWYAPNGHYMQPDDWNGRIASRVVCSPSSAPEQRNPVLSVFFNQIGVGEVVLPTLPAFEGRRWKLVVDSSSDDPFGHGRAEIRLPMGARCELNGIGVMVLELVEDDA